MSKHGENIYRRKDGRWEARYIFMRLPDGKAKYKSVYGKTHDIAKEKQLAGMLALAKDETSPCVLTVKELFTQYLAQADVKTSTRERYWFMLERHIVPYFGKMPVAKLTGERAFRFSAASEEEWEAGRERRLVRKNRARSGCSDENASSLRAARIPLRLRRAEHETACLRAEKYRGSLRAGAGGHEQSPIAVKEEHLCRHAGAARRAARGRGLCFACARY